MNATELKHDLLKLILDTDDISVLTQVRTYLNNLNNKSTDWYEGLSEDNIEEINQGLRDVQEGNTFADDYVRASIRQKIENAKQK